MCIRDRFGKCVIHFTTFDGDVHLGDVVQNFISANQESIWTLTNTTNANLIIQPEPEFHEICSVNVLLNSEIKEWLLKYFIYQSIYSRREEKHSNFVIIRQKQSDFNEGIIHLFRYMPVRIFQFLLPNISE